MSIDPSLPHSFLLVSGRELISYLADLGTTMTVLNLAALPSATSSTVGQLANVAGGGADDGLYLCIESAPDVFVWHRLSSEATVFNVLEYGAKGDGTTDDTTALQAAIDAAELVRGVVEFPPGEYVTSAALVADTQGVTLRGSGRNGTVGSDGIGSVIRQTSTTADGLQVKADAITVDQLQINGPGSGSGRGLVIYDGVAGTPTQSRVSVTHTWVRNFGGVGIYAPKAELLLLDQVWSTANGGIGVLIEDVGGSRPTTPTLRNVRADGNLGTHQIHIKEAHTPILENCQALNGTAGNANLRIQSCYAPTIIGGDFEGGGASGIQISSLGGAIINAKPVSVATGINCTSWTDGVIQGGQFPSSLTNSVVVDANSRVTIVSPSDASTAGVSWASGAKGSVIRGAITDAGGQVYNVKAYGAKGDGSTDDTTKIQAAIDAANTAGGGTVFFPTGTYIATTLTYYSKIQLVGTGPDATILKLKNSSNVPLLQSSQYATLTGGGTTGGVDSFAIRDMTLDGNKANNTTGGYGIRNYGRRFTLDNVVIRDFKNDGIKSEWATSSGYLVGTASMEARVRDVHVHDCDGHGINWDGPHDSQFVNVVPYKNGSNGFNITSNAVGCQFVNCHSWGTPQDWAWWIEASYCVLMGCFGESSDVGQLMIAASSAMVYGGRYFMAADTAVKGIQLGNGVNVTGCTIYTDIYHCTGGAVVFNNDGGGNKVEVGIFQSAGTVVSGSPSTSTEFDPRVSGVSFTYNGRRPFPLLIRDTTSAAFQIANGTGTMFNIRADSGNERFETVRGAGLRGYSDGFSTQKYDISGATGTAKFAGGLWSQAVVTKTAAYTATLDDQVILCDAAGGAFTITLPTAGGNTGKTFTIKRTSASNNVTVDGNASETIDGALTKVLGSQYAFITIASNGSNWFIVASGGTIT